MIKNLTGSGPAIKNKKESKATNRQHSTVHEAEGNIPKKEDKFSALLQSIQGGEAKGKDNKSNLEQPQKTDGKDSRSVTKDEVVKNIKVQNNEVLSPVSTKIDENNETDNSKHNKNKKIKIDETDQTGGNNISSLIPQSPKDVAGNANNLKNKNSDQSGESEDKIIDKKKILPNDKGYNHLIDNNGRKILADFTKKENGKGKKALNNNLEIDKSVPEPKKRPDKEIINSLSLDKGINPEMSNTKTDTGNGVINRLLVKGESERTVKEENFVKTDLGQNNGEGKKNDTIIDDLKGLKIDISKKTILGEESINSEKNVSKTDASLNDKASGFIDQKYNIEENSQILNSKKGTDNRGIILNASSKHSLNKEVQILQPDNEALKAREVKSFTSTDIKYMKMPLNSGNDQIDLQPLVNPDKEQHTIQQNDSHKRGLLTLTERASTDNEALGEMNKRIRLIPDNKKYPDKFGGKEITGHLNKTEGKNEKGRIHFYSFVGDRIKVDDKRISMNPGYKLVRVNEEQTKWVSGGNSGNNEVDKASELKSEMDPKLWKDQITVDQDIKDSKGGETKNAGYMSLRQLPIANVTIRKQVLPGLTQAVLKASTGAAENTEKWQKHNFVLEDGKNFHFSARQVDGVLQLKLGSLHGDLNRLLQLHQHQLKTHLEHECNLTIDLQFDNNEEQNMQGFFDESPSGNSRSINRGTSDGKTTNQRVEKVLLKTIRSFGYNKMEWTV